MILYNDNTYLFHLTGHGSPRECPARVLTVLVPFDQTSSLHCYPGIHMKTVDDAFRILYDLHQVIRYRLALDRSPKEQNPWSVDFHDPRQSSSAQPLAKIEPIDSK